MKAADRTELSDRAHITELLSRFCSIIDDKRISVSTVADIFTPDGRIINPNGTAVVGPEAIAAEKAKSFSRFKATQHITSDYIIDLNGDTAQFRANMIAMHLWSEEENDPRSLQTHFVAGGVFEAAAVRTARGRRFRKRNHALRGKRARVCPQSPKPANHEIKRE